MSSQRWDAQGGAHEELLDELLRLVRQGEAASLEELSRRSFVSEFYLSRLLKRRLGFPLRDFLSAVKVDRSISRIVAGDSVTQAGVDSGYESPSSFSRMFLKHTGVGPARFRAQLRDLAQLLRDLQYSGARWRGFYRTFSVEDHRHEYPLTIRVVGASAGSTLFVAVHSDVLIRAEPVLGVALHGVDEVLVDAIPDGTYYVMVVEVPCDRGLGRYFRMAENRRALARVPVTFPLSQPQEVTLELREILANDPPITVNLPHLLREGLRRSALEWFRS
ncbi:AraC family transcriptional regulator [Corynebacterium felinum]|uniref:AraC-like DNA-binding protein n=1 Tax=Corynebacterium felinum TaxID=131318 RepID=A0ABU2B620_9CORY|nr:AraC family transcriptional regulator [Corynebacterium felinum]MDF5820819.1 AraC family transcriptional regulator [Corynebacterium felinum]MDR7354065.1 AraC-like DNA-binding protein [Corynebacterium felinum]